MSHKDQNQQRAAQEGKPMAKKPYAKPEVRYERVFETMALSCGKVGSTEGPCSFNRKNS